MIPRASASPPSSSWHLDGERGFVQGFMKNNPFVVVVVVGGGGVLSIFLTNLHFFWCRLVFKPGKYVGFHF